MVLDIIFGWQVGFNNICFIDTNIIIILYLRLYCKFFVHNGKKFFIGGVRHELMGLSGRAFNLLVYVNE